MPAVWLAAVLLLPVGAAMMIIPAGSVVPAALGPRYFATDPMRARVADFSGNGSDAACAGQCDAQCPCATLQSAFRAARDHDTVLVVPPSDGTAIPCEGAWINKSLTLMPAPWVAQRVVLDCGGEDRALWFDGSAREAPLRVAVRQVTVRNGMVRDGGGCIRADDTELELSGCELCGCSVHDHHDLAGHTEVKPHAQPSGGGVRIVFHRDLVGALVNLSNSVFTDCHADLDGGSVSVLFLGPVQHSAVHITDSHFASSGAAGYCGAVDIEFVDTVRNASTPIVRSTFTSTRAGFEGGAVCVGLYHDASHVSMPFLHSTFTGSQAGSSGGAVSIVLDREATYISTPILHSTFTGSEAGDCGGAVLWTAAGNVSHVTTAISHSTFSGTRSGRSGGALHLEILGNAKDASVLIVSSSFTDTMAGADGGAVFLSCFGDAVQVVSSVSHTAFTNTSAGDNGGAVYMQLVKVASNVSTSVSTSTFSHTKSVGYGGALFLGLMHSASHLNSSVAQTTFSGTTAGHSGGAVCVQFSGAAAHVFVPIERSSFMDAHAGQHGGAVAVHFDGDTADATVALTHSTFGNTTAGKFGGAVRVQLQAVSQASTLIAHCTFMDARAGEFGGAIDVTMRGDAAHIAAAFLHIAFGRCTAGRSAGAVYVGFSRVANHASVSFAHAVFDNSTASRGGGAVYVEFNGDAPHAAVSVAHTAFEHSYAAIGGAVLLLFDGNATGTSIEVSNSSFRHARAGVAGGALWVMDSESDRVQVAIVGCTFVDCQAHTKGGAVYAVLARQQSPLPSVQCVTLEREDVQARAWSSSSWLTVRDSSFTNVSCTSVACEGGALELVGGMLNFSNSNVSHAAAGAAGGFLHTSGSAGVIIAGADVRHVAADVGAHIQHDGAGELHISDAVFRYHDAEAAGRPVLRATSAAGEPLLTGSVLLRCNDGETLADTSLGASQSTENWLLAPCPTKERATRGTFGMVTVLSVDAQWQCTSCPGDTYLLGAGFLTANASFPATCTPCPFGAICEGGARVRAKPDMWGTLHGQLHASTPLLADPLLRCAPGYCCSDSATCASFDSCARHRTGVLCGRCGEGTVGVLGSTSCRPRERCGAATQDVLFWPGSLLLMAGFVAWQVRTAGREGGGKATSAGATKATFAFFQCFPLLLLGDMTAGSAAGALLSSLSSIFSFQLQLGGGGGGGGDAGVCLFGGLTAVQAQGLQVLMVLVLLLAVMPTLWLVHCLLGWFGPALGGVSLLPPRAAVYGGALTSLLMLTYSTMTAVSVRLVTCVDVAGMGSRLLIQGSEVCWSVEAWWQWVAAAWGLGSVLLMPMSLVVGGRLLRSRKLRLAWFWVSLVLPLPCLLVWGARWCWMQLQRHSPPQRRESRTWHVPAGLHQALQQLQEQQYAASSKQVALQRVAAEVQDVTTSSVRSAALRALRAGYCSALWWWDAVLLLRRLLLTALPLLLHDSPVLHALVALLLLLLFLMAHLHVRPMASPAAHALEAGYLACLLLVAAVSVVEGTQLWHAVRAEAHSRSLLPEMAGAVVVLLMLVPSVALLATAYHWSKAGGGQLYRSLLLRCRCVRRRRQAARSQNEGLATGAQRVELSVMKSAV